MSSARTLSIALFGLVAIAHAMRLLMGWAVTIDSWLVPMWVSVVGTLVPAGLAVSLWKESSN